MPAHDGLADQHGDEDQGQLAGGAGGERSRDDQSGGGQDGLAGVRRAQQEQGSELAPGALDGSDRRASTGGSTATAAAGATGGALRLRPRRLSFQRDMP